MTIIELDRSNKVQKDNIESNDDEKINICFYSIDGIKRFNKNIAIPYNYPIGIILLHYTITTFYQEQIMDLINGNNTLLFLFNGMKLTINDNTKVGTIFKNVINPKIVIKFMDK